MRDMQGDWEGLGADPERSAEDAGPGGAGRGGCLTGAGKGGAPGDVGEDAGPSGDPEGLECPRRTRAGGARGRGRRGPGARGGGAGAAAGLTRRRRRGRWW